MSGMNKFMATGRLGKDPEIRYSQDGNTCIARFSMSIDKKDKDHSTGWINVVAMGRLGEFSEKYLKKGMKVELEAHVSPGSYKNKDGVTVYTYDFLAESIDFAESKSNGNNNVSAQSTSAPAEPVDDGFMNIPEGLDEELPFN